MFQLGRRADQEEFYDDDDDDNDTSRSETVPEPSEEELELKVQEVRNAKRKQRAR